MILILNKKYVKDSSRYNGETVYIGRPSVLGNPFVIGKDGNRAEVIEKYKLWLRERWTTGGDVKKELIRLAKKHKAGENLNLLCWCHPMPCHGEVIKDAIEKISKRI